jgi:hypothetical protein
VVEAAELFSPQAVRNYGRIPPEFRMICLTEETRI